jgi:hypothetical protein
VILSEKAVQLASSCDEKVGRGDLFGRNQGKTEKNAWTNRNVANSEKRMTKRKLPYQHQNEQTQKQTISDISQRPRPKTLGEGRTVEIEASHFRVPRSLG